MAHVFTDVDTCQNLHPFPTIDHDVLCFQVFTKAMISVPSRLRWKRLSTTPKRYALGVGQMTALASVLGSWGCHIKYHKLGGLKQQTFLPSQSQRLESEIKVSKGPCPHRRLWVESLFTSS